MKVQAYIGWFFGVLLILGWVQIWYAQNSQTDPTRSWWSSDAMSWQELRGETSTWSQESAWWSAEEEMLPLDLLSGATQDAPADRQKQLKQYKGTDLLYQKYLLAIYLYEKHQDTTALTLAISFATQLGRFDEAYALIKLLPDIGTLHDTVDASVLMQLLFNSSELLDFARLKQLKDLVNTLYDQEKIAEDEYNFYYLLITLVKTDKSNTLYYLEKLRGTAYEHRYHQLRQLMVTAESYPNVPSYYMWWLRAMYAYQQWWRWPSLHIAQTIRQQDPNYLLAEQLIAYNSIALQQWTGAIYALQHLQQIDASQQETYQYFQWIAHFFVGQYELSIAVMSNLLDHDVYTDDALRYIYLWYVSLEDWIHAGEIAQRMATKNDLVIADLYTLFDTFFFQEMEVGINMRFPLYETNSAVIEQLILRCEREFTDYPYVCMYGKAWQFLAWNEYLRALQALKRVVKRYPRSALYILMGSLAQTVWLTGEAVVYFEQGFLLTEEDKWGRIGDVQLPWYLTQ